MRKRGINIATGIEALEDRVLLSNALLVDQVFEEKFDYSFNKVPEGWTDEYYAGPGFPKYSRGQAGNLGVSIRVVDSGSEFGKVVRLLDRSSNITSEISKNVEFSKPIIILEYEMLSNNSNFEGAFVHFDGDGINSYEVAFSNGIAGGLAGWIGVHGTNRWEKPNLMEYNEDTWYSVRRTIDLSSKKLTFEVWQTDNVNNYASFNFFDSRYHNEIDRIKIFTSNSQGSDSYIDNISVSERNPSLSVITHGFQLDKNLSDWTLDMAEAISDRNGYVCDHVQIGNSVIRYDVDGNFVSHNNDCDPVVIFDWAEKSGLSYPGFADNEQVSGTLASIVRNRILERDTIDVHFIGHSRGSFVNADVIRRLSDFDDVVGRIGLLQMTTLDPQSYLPGTDGKLEGNPGGIVDWSDNYFQTSDGFFEPAGKFISGSYNLDLTEILKGWEGRVRLPSEHAEVHDWYHGTIDVGNFNDKYRNVPVIDGDARMLLYGLEEWDEGNRVGYYWSLFGGGFDNRPNVQIKKLNLASSEVNNDVIPVFNLGNDNFIQLSSVENQVEFIPYQILNNNVNQGNYVSSIKTVSGSVERRKLDIEMGGSESMEDNDSMSEAFDQFWTEFSEKIFGYIDDFWESLNEK